MNDISQNLKKAENVMKGFDKDLKDISQINPLKGEINDLNQDLKKAEDTLKGLDKELKDISKINPLKNTNQTESSKSDS